MNQSSFSDAKRLRTALYPFAFPIIAIILGVATYQVVNRLAIETAITKLTTIVDTGATAISVWSENHQNAIGLLATNESWEQAALQLAQNDGSTIGEDNSSKRVLQERFDAFSDSFPCFGFSLFSSHGRLLHSYQPGGSLPVDLNSTNEFIAQSLAEVSLEIEDSQQSNTPPKTTTCFDFGSGVVYFSSPVGHENEVNCTLVVAVSSDSGLNSILESLRVGESGFAFMINHAADQDWTEAWPSNRNLSPATHEMMEAAFPNHLAKHRSTDASAARDSTRILGLDKSVPSECIGARKRLGNSDNSLITIVERDEVFKATMVLKRILLLILGLSVLASAMNWRYVLRLSSLRNRVSDASDAIRRLGQYNLEEKIGEGGMGVVYRASHSMLQRPTAVKLILPDRASDKSIANFEREVMLTSRLTHPNTIAIYDYGRNEEGTFYYAMEYLNGINLATLVNLEGKQPWPRVVHILSQVCDSLAEAHSTGLIHRDIKPENVMLCKRGNRHDVVKVLDFGLAGDFSNAERSEATRVQGTPAYMAPEAILQPDQVDPRVDVYAVGALGYFLLAARHIFSGETASSILSQQLNSRPIPLTQRRPEIPEKLQTLIMSCLEKDRNDRPEKIETMRQELVAISTSNWSEQEARDGWLRIQKHQSADLPPEGQKETPVIHSISKTLDL